MSKFKKIQEKVKFKFWYWFWSKIGHKYMHDYNVAISDYTYGFHENNIRIKALRCYLKSDELLFPSDGIKRIVLARQLQEEPFAQDYNFLGWIMDVAGFQQEKVRQSNEYHNKKQEMQEGEHS